MHPAGVMRELIIEGWRSFWCYWDETAA